MISQSSQNGKPVGHARIYEKLGVTFTRHSGKEFIAEKCPYCSGRKFSVNDETGQFQCFSKIKCGKKGNSYKFINDHHARCLKDTTTRQYRILAKRRGLKVETLKNHGLAWDSTGKCWLIPCYSKKGKAQNLLRYFPRMKSGNKFNLPELETRLFGLEELSDDNERILILTEGSFDAMAIDELLKKAGIREQYDILGLPGAEGFKKDWATYLSGRTVWVCMDNDTAGQEKSVTRIQKECRAKRVSCSLHVLKWPKLKKYSEKYDINDLLKSPPREGIEKFLKRNIEPVESECEAEANNSIDLINLTPPVLKSPAYHGITGEFLEAVSEYTEATDAGVIAHFLTAIGNYIGDGPYVYGGGNHPARVNTALCGDTSTGRKGTAAEPVKLLMKSVDFDFWEQQVTEGLSSGEGLIARVSDRKEKDEDGNTEIIPVEKRLLVIEPEFSKVLIQTRRTGNILSQILREVFDSGNLSVLTRKSLSAKNAHISIVGHITPGELKKRLSEVEMVNGFGNRFLWFYVKSDKVLPEAEPIPNSVIKKFTRNIKSAYSFAQKIERLERDAKASEYWIEIYPGLREDRPGFTGALTARGTSMVLRLSLIYALLDKSKVIKVEHLKAALAVWDYNVASVNLLFGDKTGSDLSDKLYKLLESGPLKSTEFHSHTNQTAGEINQALEELITAGRIRRIEKKKQKVAGRPALIYERINTDSEPH